MSRNEAIWRQSYVSGPTTGETRYFFLALSSIANAQDAICNSLFYSFTSESFMGNGDFFSKSRVIRSLESCPGQGYG